MVVNCMLLTVCCPQVCRPQTGWKEKVNDADSYLPHHQPIRRMSTSWSCPPLWTIAIKFLTAPSRSGHTVLRALACCGPCQLQIGTCHLPLHGLSQMALQVLTFNTPWKEFRVEIRNEALGALRKTGGTGLQRVRYFQELILWAQFLHLLISRKHYTFSSWWHLLLVTSSNLHKTFCKNMCLIVCILPSPKSHIYWPSPPTSLEQFLRAIRNAVSQAAVLILPQIKLNSQLSHCAFLF